VNPQASGPPLDIFTVVGMADSHERNRGRSAGPPPERWIVMAVLIDWPSSTPEKTTALCKRLEQKGYRLTVGVSHPPIYEFDDWFKIETWQAVADAFELMKDHAGDVVCYDVEAYRLKGRRNPRTKDVMTDGWRLADAARPLIDWLKTNKKKLLVEQAHETHLFEHVMRINGIDVIWADSTLKPMPYSVYDAESIAAWERVAAERHAEIRSFGATRWPTLRARGLIEPEALRIALKHSDGRINIFFGDSLEQEADPMAKWNYPKRGWADKLRPIKLDAPK
jgi:hypothetical protein